MEKPNPQSFSSDQALGRHSPWPWVLALGALLVILLALLLPRQRTSRDSADAATGRGQVRVASGAGVEHARWARGHSAAVLTAEEIVAGKVTRFAQDRLRITHAMAERFKVKVAPDVERFFQAVREGRWGDLKAAFKTPSSAVRAEMRKIWARFGVPSWRPSSLPSAPTIGRPRNFWITATPLWDRWPGMVYVGGTDPGRGIPTLLNATCDGDQHMVITQNALADAGYVQYVNFLYGDQMAALTPEDSQKAFQDYVADAQQRLAHDQQFPDEPKQIRPGEDVQVVDNQVRVSGQVAVMAINENLLQTFMAKNPDLSFALEESFPLQSTYPNAVPLGPLMELGVQDVPDTFTSAAAAQAVDYWRDTAQQFLSDAETPADSPARLAYAKMAAAQAALLADHQYDAEAEQAYRVAVEISPASPEAVYGLGQLLATTGRADEARQLVADFESAHPSGIPIGLAVHLQRGG